MEFHCPPELAASACLGGVHHLSSETLKRDVSFNCQLPAIPSREMFLALTIGPFISTYDTWRAPTRYCLSSVFAGSPWDEESFSLQYASRTGVSPLCSCRCHGYFSFFRGRRSWAAESVNYRAFCWLICCTFATLRKLLPRLKSTML